MRTTHPYQRRYANHPWPNSRPRLVITGLVTILVSGLTSYSLATYSLADQLRVGWIAVTLAGIVGASLWIETRRRSGKSPTRWGGPTRPRHWQRHTVEAPIRIRRGHNCHLESELDESTPRLRRRPRNATPLAPNPRSVEMVAALTPASIPHVPEVEPPLSYRPAAEPGGIIAPPHIEDQRAEEPSPINPAPSPPDVDATVRIRPPEQTMTARRDPADPHLPAGSLIFQPFQPYREQPSAHAPSGT